MDTDAEQWRQVAGWPYEVSSLGNVRRSGRASGATVGLVLKQHTDQGGYKKILLAKDGGGGKWYTVHRLVLEAFVEPCPVDHNANHRNGVKSDNRVENLEWVTRSENQVHAYETGLQGRGEDHGRAKLTDEQVRTIRREYKGDWGEQGRIAAEYGVSQNLVSKILRGTIWGHLDPDYKPQAPRKQPYHGEAHGLSKLTEDSVRAIRVRFAAGGVSQAALAAEFGVRQTLVSQIVRRRIWKHVE